MSRTEILAAVDMIASYRLFAEARWLVDRTTAIALDRTLEMLGLVEQLSDAITYRDTSLGKELNIDLQEVFMGLWEPWDAIHVLKDHDLVSDDEIDSLFDMLEIGQERFEPILRARVQQAYRDYYRATRLH